MKKLLILSLLIFITAALSAQTKLIRGAVIGYPSDSMAQIDSVREVGSFITVYVGGVPYFFGSDSTILGGLLLDSTWTSSLIDTINEYTTAHGVLVDGLLIKDAGIDMAAAVTIDSDNGVYLAQTGSNRFSASTQNRSYVDLMMNPSTEIKTFTTLTNTFSLSAYDVDGTAYLPFITFTAANTPTMTFPQSGGGTVNFLAADGTWIPPDHGLLTGLAGDDHTQYHTVSRANTWFATKDLASLGTKSHTSLTDKGTLTHAQIDDSITIFSDSIISIGDSVVVFSDSIASIGDSIVAFSASIIVLNDSAQVFSDSIANLTGNLATHTANTSNPHSVDATDILPDTAGNQTKYLQVGVGVLQWATASGGAGGDSIVTTTDSIKEWTGAHGVWIDGLYIKDGRIAVYDDSLNIHQDSITANKARIVALEAIGAVVFDSTYLHARADSFRLELDIAATDIENLQDSMITVYADSLAVHSDTLNAHNTRLTTAEAAIITNAGGIADLVIISDSSYATMTAGTINEYTNGAGVTVEGVLIEDGLIASQYVVGDSVNQLWQAIMEDTIEIDTIAHMLIDTLIWPGGAGLGITYDTTWAQVDANLLEWPVLQDSVVFDSVYAYCEGVNGSITINLYWIAGWAGDSPVDIVAADLVPVTGTAAGTSEFEVLAIGPGAIIRSDVVDVNGAGSYRPDKVRIYVYYHEKRAF